MVREAWSLVKESVISFVADDALSKGASIAFYMVTSIAPVLVIVIAIAGLAFGHDAAQGAIAAQLSGLMGDQSAELLQTAIHSASGKSSGIIATALGLLMLLVTASGVFGEMQSSLNAIWKTPPQDGTVTRLMAITRLVKARAASLGLVAALGFLVAGLVGDKPRGARARHLHQRPYPVRAGEPVSSELRDLFAANFRVVRGNLQNSARYAS